MNTSLLNALFTAFMCGSDKQDFDWWYLSNSLLPNTVSIQVHQTLHRNEEWSLLSSAPPARDGFPEMLHLIPPGRRHRVKVSTQFHQSRKPMHRYFQACYPSSFGRLDQLTDWITTSMLPFDGTLDLLSWIKKQNLSHFIWDVSTTCQAEALKRHHRKSKPRVIYLHCQIQQIYVFPEKALSILAAPAMKDM